MGGKLSKKKKGWSVKDEKAKDKDKKAEGTGTEEEGTLKGMRPSDGAPALDSKPSSPEAAPSSKEFPAATESPSSMPKVQATTAPAAPSDEVKSETPS
uniref:Brain acid soluble protein 1 n=1 Tax=Sus scrofa TaxID=9823 RepID=A0A8D1MS26_PIG